MQDFVVRDFADGVVVALPNQELSDVAYYQHEVPIDGRTVWNLAPVVALPYIMETDGRQVVDESSMANPGLSSVIPVGELDNQGPY